MTPVPHRLRPLLALALAAPAAAGLLTGARLDFVELSASGHPRTLSGVLAPPSATRRAQPPAERARDFLVAHAAELGLPVEPEALAHQGTVESILGTTVRFQRMAAGVPVVPGTVLVHLDRDGTISRVTNESSPQAMPAEVELPMGTDAALAAALADLAPQGALRGTPTARAVVSTERGRAEGAFEVVIPAARPFGDWRYLIDGEGAVISRTNLAMRAHGTVFDPNAVAALKQAGLTDQNDAAAAVPQAAYSQVELLGLDGSGHLTGQYVSTEDTANRAHEPSGEFHYNRQDKRFEEVMIYAMIDRAQRRFQALGIANANNRRQVLDAHGTNDDNSWYSPATKKLTFGDGGVDDAEDAEIIWHEYGHSTQDNQVPGWGAGGNARAMGEGFGDYLAAAMSQQINTYQNECVGDWDGVSYSNTNPPCLRRTDGTKHYPEDLKNQEHADGEIWSAFLWSVHQAIGDGDQALRLVLAHHFLLAPGATMPEAASALLQADQNLYGGAHRQKIKALATARGLMQATSFLKLSLKSAAGAPVGGKATVSGLPGAIDVPAATGTVTVRMAPGTYTVAVSCFGYLDPAPRTFTVDDDQTAEVALVLQQAPSADLTGTVRTAAGQPLAGAKVFLKGTPLAPFVTGPGGTFKVTAPAGTYALLVAAIGFESKTVPGATIPGSGLAVVLDPVPPTLLVDDDGAKAYEAFFAAALTDAGQAHKVLSLAEGTELGFEDLVSFQTVVWATGDRYQGLFPGNTAAALKAYVENGGRLILSGQEVGYGAGNTAFYKDVLGAKFVKDSAGSRKVEGAGLSLAIEGGDGADNQKYPDVIEAGPEATLWLKYTGGTEGAGLVAHRGAGRIVYLSFGLEGVSTRAGRKALLQKCFEAAGEAVARRRTAAQDWFAR